MMIAFIGCDGSGKTTLAKRLIKKVVPMLSGQRNCQCSSALKYAIITDKKLIPGSIKKKLDIIIGKYV